MASKSADMSAVASKRVTKKEAMRTRQKTAQSKRIRNKLVHFPLTPRSLTSPPHLQVNKNDDAKTYGSPKPDVRADSPKSPKKLAESIKPLPKSPKNKKCKEVLETTKEYYPNKKKRTVFSKKVVLKPKYELKVVERLNKRKLITPRKDSNFYIPIVDPALPPQKVPEPSFEELLRLADDMDSMTDEDLMEILTCPSPVWWEAPVNPEYEEDPIFPRPRRPAPTQQEAKPTNLQSSTKISKMPELKPEIKLISELEEIGSKSSNKITKKRYLENILGNIKKKVNKSTPSNDSDTRKSNKNDTKINRVQTISLSESSATEDELFTDKNEDILRDLENLDIPVAKSDDINEKVDLLSPVECIFLEEDAAPCDPMVDYVSKQPVSEIEEKFEASMLEGIYKIQPSSSSLIKQTRSLVPKKIIFTIKTNDKKKIKLDLEEYEDNKDTETKQEEEVEVPNEMPPLKRFPKVSENDADIACPYSNPSSDNFEMDAVDSSSITSREPDTISDTNIKFLTDEQVNGEENLNGDENNDPLAPDTKTESDLEGEKQKTVTEDSIEKDKNMNIGKTNERDDEEEKITEYAVDDSDITIDDNEKKRERIVVYKIIEADSDIEQPASVTEHNNYFSNKSKTAKANKKINETVNADKVNKKMTNKIRVKVKSIKRKANVNVDKRKVEDDLKIPITDSNGPKKAKMHYCRVCSSIFDTPECKYCKEKSIQNNSMETNKL
ncbi:uncharacterized protein LOC105385016 [Plutella xylostella]|uniref:uncharacterized protein LOC105385016 n=1 Tax=Plutella xylostella TaxID=51655 RepID=UPI002032934B|nr:uncharacterized protein LOC105385016 [Plutella xylostella]